MCFLETNIVLQSSLGSVNVVGGDQTLAGAIETALE